MFTVVETQPTTWWQTGQWHDCKHKNPNVGCLHLSVQLYPKYPAGQSSEWTKDDKYQLKKNCKRSAKNNGMYKFFFT